MGFAKFLGIILLFLLIIVGVLAVDIFMTASDLSDVDPETLVSSPSYSASADNSTVILKVTVSLPDAGFIPKGVIIKLIVDFDGETQTQEEELNLGDEKIIELSFKLPSTQQQTLSSGLSLSVDADAEVTPTFLGFAITQAKQDVDLGTQTIFG
ncbi:MAG: hypothetical protein ACXAB7_03035 [Candidatus Kariarchaeaceae archaeon]|jgi:hypothetical protein